MYAYLYTYTFLPHLFELTTHSIVKIVCMLILLLFGTYSPNIIFGLHICTLFRFCFHYYFLVFLFGCIMEWCLFLLPRFHVHINNINIDLSFFLHMCVYLCCTDWVCKTFFVLLYFSSKHHTKTSKRHTK